MKFDKSLKFIIGRDHFVFRTLYPNDVSEAYIDFLRKETSRLQEVTDTLDIEWQKNYIKKILLSPCDTICGLFRNLEFIGTSGIQNLSRNESDNQPIKIAHGFSFGCTLGILIFNKMLRGKGYGKTLVWSSCLLAHICCGVETFRGCLEVDNKPSFKSFIASGFQVEVESKGSIDVKLQIKKLIQPEFVENIIFE